MNRAPATSSPTFVAVVNYLLKGIGIVGLAFIPLMTNGAGAPDEAPILHAFPPNQLDGETTFWQIAQTADGQILAGGERLLFYQGNQWRAIAKLRRQAIRSLLIDGPSLWIASVNEVGRIRLPLRAENEYSAIASKTFSTVGEIWTLAKSDQSLIAASSQDVWLINPLTEEVTQTHLANKGRVLLNEISRQPILTQWGESLWRVSGDRLERFPNPLPDKSDIFWLYASSSFVLTKRSLYKKTADEFQVIADMRELDKAIMTSAVAWGKSVAIATYMKGVALVDLDTGSTKFVTRAAGLPTLGATTVFADSTNRLWVGTDKGIAVLESPRFGHTIPVKENPVSAIRAGGLLIGYEDRAEYFHEGREDEKLSHVFSLTPTSHGLAVGLFGSVRVGSREFKTPGNQVGSVVDLLNGRLLATTGEILYQLDFASGQAEVVPGIPEKISQLHSFSGHVWMSSASGKIYRAEARAPFTFTKVADLPDGDTDAAISNLGSVLVVAGRESVRFGEKLSVVANTLGVRNPRLAKTKSDLWLVADQDGEHRLGKLVPSGDAVSWETVEAKGLAALPDVHYFSASDDALMFCGGNTILELYAAELKPAYRLAAPLLEFTLADAKSGAITTLPSPPEKLSSEKNSLTFSGTLPYDEFGEKPAYERRLLPTETVWIPTKAGEKVSYPSLSPRHYTLEVRATHLGHQGTTTALAFTVLPPWFASPEAFAGYVALALVSGYSLFRLRTRQIRLRNLQLETIVQERTSELAKASAAKTEFLASMSHEIRNPMNGVIGLVNILREETPTPRQAHTLKLLHGCAEQLRSTVDDILDFSKIEAGHVVLERSTFDLLDTLEASAATVDPTRRKITFVDRPPAGLSLRGDAGKLRQIFANYLSNALKYGIPPEARVSTILVPTDDSVRLTLSVTSSGPTIAKDTLDGFFESFARGADAMERNIHGTGLGLAICKRYAQAMGGEVGAVSTNGETTFYLNIPFAKANEAAPLPAVVAAPVSALPAKALAIEDEDYNRIVLGSILTKMNYTVDWATTGAEALQLARENGYDIVLTDYRLPDTNGVDLAREILQLCPEPKPAVFAVTAYSTKERRDECLNAGMAGFISKPITLEKLRATLAAWGDKQLTTISLESTRRPLPKQPPAAIESGWIELKRAALIDTVRAAELAHRLNNVCRAFNYLDLAEQLELLEGALERGEPAAPFLQACERLLRPSEGDQLS